MDPSLCLPFTAAGPAVHDSDFSHGLDRFGNALERRLNAPVQDLRPVPVLVPIIQAVSKRSVMFLRRAIRCSEHLIPHGHTRLNVISATNLAMRPTGALETIATNGRYLNQRGGVGIVMKVRALTCIAGVQAEAGDVTGALETTVEDALETARKVDDASDRAKALAEIAVVLAATRMRSRPREFLCRYFGTTISALSDCWMKTLLSVHRSMAVNARQQKGLINVRSKFLFRIR